MRISAVRCFVVEGPVEIPAQEERQERLNIVQNSAREFLAGEWSPKQFRELIALETERWRNLVAELGLEQQ